MQAKGQNTLTVSKRSKHARSVAGRPFRSLLVPHFLFIRARRQAGATWQEIAEALARDHGIQIGAAGVQRFFARTTKRKAWPLGMEPDVNPTKSASQDRPEPPTKGSLFGGTNRRGKSQAAVAATAEPSKPKPYRSAMNPHLPFIREQRTAQASWQEIADALRARKGVDVTRQAVAEFYSRTLAREAKERAAKTQAGQPAAPTRPASSQDDDPFSEDDELSKLSPL